MRDELFPALTFPQFGISLLLTLQNESSAAAAPSAKSSSSRQSTLERERTPSASVRFGGLSL